MSSRAWSRVAWVVLLTGVLLAIWGISMGLSEPTVSGRYTQVNDEAVFRLVAGSVLILCALVVATVTAPRLSPVERRLWAVVILMAVSAVAIVPLFWVAEETSTCSAGEAGAAMGCFLEDVVKAVLGAGLVASLVTAFWLLAADARTSKEITNAS